MYFIKVLTVNRMGNEDWSFTLTLETSVEKSDVGSKYPHTLDLQVPHQVRRKQVKVQGR